jgi:uncharacterized membrane protein YfcA
VLSLPQHVAQGISLVAQVPPTSAGGVLQYRRSGHAVRLRWVVLLSIGFVVGAIGGAVAAGTIPDRPLRWPSSDISCCSVCCRCRALRRDGAAAPGRQAVMLGAVTLLCVGIVSGLSSGLLGIGGGLAITAIPGGRPQGAAARRAGAGARRHDPAAHPAGGLGLCRAGTRPALVGDRGHRRGTVASARQAGRGSRTLLSERTLQRMMPVCIFAMAAFMAWRAL